MNNYYFVDTHAHIFNEYYEDINTIVDNAKSKKIKIIINNGCDQKSNEEVIQNLSDNLYGAIGIHPESVEFFQESDLDYIKNNLSKPKIVAIGEIGLDYHYSKENKDKQIKLFEAQLQIAEENQIPIIVHSRDATEDTINTLKKYNVKGVIHSFSGSYETAQVYIKMGFKLGINGVVTFKNSHLIEVLKKLSLNDFVLETDSPYLTPVPNRGKRNEPAYIIDIVNYISQELNITREILSEATNNNIKEVFKKIHMV